jgi:hypothetical protein
MGGGGGRGWGNGEWGAAETGGERGEAGGGKIFVFGGEDLAEARGVLVYDFDVAIAEGDDAAAAGEAFIVGEDGVAAGGGSEWESHESGEIVVAVGFDGGDEGLPVGIGGLGRQGREAQARVAKAGVGEASRDDHGDMRGIGIVLGGAVDVAGLDDAAEVGGGEIFQRVHAGVFPDGCCDDGKEGEDGERGDEGAKTGGSG